MPTPIYLDYNGTTPHAPEVIEAMRPYLEREFGNPSSSHWYGIAPRRAIAKARSQVAALLGCTPEELIFTSGGTESNNHAIKGVALARQERGRHIITCAIEHPAVLEVCRWLEKSNFTTSYLPVDEHGMVSLENLRQSIRKDTVLITIMHANNEVGTIQPIGAISRLAREHGITMHTDAAQSVGKIPVTVEALGVDLLSLAGHKLYAPKGVGALFIRNPGRLEKFCHGAGQEMGLRAGTENVLEIVGLGKACEIAARDLAADRERARKLRDRLHDGLQHALGERIRLNGHPEQRLPNTLSISFKNVQANRLLEEIGLELAVSPGAACHSDRVEMSHVLKAMQVPREWAMGTLRFSLGRMTTENDIIRTVEIVTRAVRHLGG